MEKYSVFDCTMVELDKHHSYRKGNITVVENGNPSTGSVHGTLPFDVKRVYYLYDIPGGESRGAHAHKDLSQLIVAASGSFRVTLDDGKCKRSFFLNRPYQGLYVKPGLWRDLDDFSSGAVCMVLASDVYLAEDYIRDLFTSRDFKTLTEGISSVNVEKIRRGMIDNGMTKQEVRLAYGPPCKYKTPDETLNTWLFWTELLVGKRIVFNNNKVTDVIVL